MTCRKFLQSMLLFSLWCLLALHSGATVAWAAVDQDQPLSPTSIDSNAANPRGQTFTVGVSGILDSIAVKLAQLPTPTLPIEFALQATAGGFPTGSPLVDLEIPIADIPAWTGSSDAMGFVNIDLSPYSIPVGVGDVLAMTLITGDGGPNVVHYTIGASHENPFADGTAIFRAAGSTTWNTLDGQWDLAFQTSVVVPEPSSLALVAGLGLTWLFAARLRRPRRLP